MQEFRQAVAEGRWDEARESVEACVGYVARLLGQVIAEMEMCVAHGVEPASWASRSARRLKLVTRGPRNPPLSQLPRLRGPREREARRP